MDQESLDWDNHYMWCERIDKYAFASQSKRKRLKRQWRDKNCVAIIDIEEEQEEYPMDTTNTETREQRRHLLSRLSMIHTEKDYKARKETFFLDDDREPWTSKDLVERIKSGKFTIDEDLEKKAREDNRYMWMIPPGPLSFIKWRDPKKVADKEGYEAWTKKALKAYEIARDDIMIQSLEDGLKTLREYESAT